MIKARRGSKTSARSVLEGVVEVPAGTGLGASFCVGDLVLEWGSISYRRSSHLPVLVNASCHQKRSSFKTFLTVPHTLSCSLLASQQIHVAKGTERYSPFCLDKISEISGMAGGWNLIFNLVISPYSLRHKTWTKISGVNTHTWATKSSTETTCFFTRAVHM